MTLGICRSKYPHTHKHTRAVSHTESHNKNRTVCVHTEFQGITLLGEELCLDLGLAGHVPNVAPDVLLHAVAAAGAPVLLSFGSVCWFVCPHCQRSDGTGPACSADDLFQWPMLCRENVRCSPASAAVAVVCARCVYQQSVHTHARIETARILRVCKMAASDGRTDGGAY